MIEHQFHRFYSSIEEEEEEEEEKERASESEERTGFVFLFLAFFDSLRIFTRIKYDFRETLQQERIVHLTKP